MKRFLLAIVLVYAGEGLAKMSTARSFVAHTLIVMLERSEASYERMLRSRITGSWLDLMT